MFRKAMICAAAGLALAGTAQAGLVGTAPAGLGFTDSWSTFQLVTGGRVSTNLTDLFAAGDPDPVDPSANASVVNLRISSLGATLSGAGNLRTGNFNGRHAVDDTGTSLAPGGAFIEGGAASLVIVFDTAISAFGFWGVDIGDFGAGGECTPGNTNCGTQGKAFSVQLFSDASSLGTFDLGGTGQDGKADFYGLLAPGRTFNRAVITNSDQTDGQGFSRMTTATSASIPPGGNAPEPGALALVGIGLFGLRRMLRA